MENNNKTLLVLVDLKPNKEYEFILTNKGFISKEGYLLKDEKFLIRFKTGNK
ncbi:MULTISPECIES: hypothetical protein [unclassified Chryseobacterium]|uniref:hypothetical protein n=1 Tax=unclassified Chryseobacterium TaxID=2593645 RepID=UPI0015E89B98|nr:MULTISPECIES: hypothetical protein [unclassified Chryseobacterium]